MGGLQVDGWGDGVEGLQLVVRRLLHFLSVSEGGEGPGTAQQEPVLTSDLEQVLT